MKDTFDTHKWFKNQYLNENIQSNKLSELIIQSINEVDENLSYEDLALAIADVLENNYGTHNYAPFIEALSNSLNIQDY
jgi:hypothetical protein